MAEAERSTKDTRVRLKRVKLDQLLECAGATCIADDDDDADKHCASDGSGNDSGESVNLNKAVQQQHVATMAATTSTEKIVHMPMMQSVACSTDIIETDFPDYDIIKALPTILSLPPFDPYTPAPPTDIVFKPVVSLMQLSLREENVIEVEVSKKLLSEYSKREELAAAAAAAASGDNFNSFMELDTELNMKLLCEYSKNMIRTPEGQMRPITDFADIFVKHDKDEFYTFCSCKECLEYREVIMNIMMDQFKAAHMVVMLLDVLIKAYSPLLKNDSAYNKFEKLLDSNKEIYWITSGYLYDKNADYLDFIDDSTISDNMVLVLFSSILMVNNPMLLLQILAYNIECIVKAFSEGIIEIAQPENGKIPAEKMLTYVLDGYSNLNCISQKISLNLFAFENDFLRRFKLSWVVLCQRLFQQHVYAHLADTMLACIITLKEEEMAQQNSSLIKRYLLFDEHMNSIEKRWVDIWSELNKFNTCEVEHNRRMSLLDVHNIFDTVVMDATSFALPDISDDEFTDFQRIEDRHLAWRNIMAFTKLKWPDGFYDQPNTLIVEDRCCKCNALLEYHLVNCKCVTCSIAGVPIAPIAAVATGTCASCATAAIVERNPKLKRSKLLSACNSDDNATISKLNAVRKCLEFEDYRDEMSVVLAKRIEADTIRSTYHIAWAVFQHLTTRKRYRHETISVKNFCTENCRVSACLLARKILNNEISPTWSQLLVRYFQPLSFSREELRATLPSIMFFNRKILPCNVKFNEQKAHDYILKVYWTFVLSIHANFFMRFNFPSVTEFTHLEIFNKDLRICLNSITGNTNDRNFETFIECTRRLSPFRSDDDLALMDTHFEQMQKSLDKLMSIHEAQIIKQPKVESANKQPASVDLGAAGATTAGNNGGSSQKNCKDKLKKCCLEYPDLTEHCKENHNKKRIKKECNHARYNETRDRLRKKFAQINERKSRNNAETNSSTPDSVPTSQADLAQSNNASSSSSSNISASIAKEPISLKTAAIAAACAKASNTCITKTKTTEENSLSCLDNLCKSIQLGKIAPTKENISNTIKASTEQFANVRAQVRVKEKGIKKMVASLQLTNDIGMVNEFYEFLDNYTKVQDKIWVNNALNFIEGTNKQQPQTKNPKKAAKKAKQKLRKEEEKRINELYDLRGQFQDIYFKEFTDKQELRVHMASSKKRDKKRISELEANIKKLQRAKAKVETAILELIATVKQTNAEFKFTYLPTKEQQLEKIRQLEVDILPNVVDIDEMGKTTKNTKVDQLVATVMNNHLQNFPQYLDFKAAPTATVSNNPYCATHASTAQLHQQQLYQHQQQTPMCYAPPQQQQLPPDVVAAMAANAVTADPSKRIVTIRRVNMPNANEPQVTVTAKGSSPDEDKLLYTFVNGQLVPSTSSTAIITMNDLDGTKMLKSANNSLRKKEQKRANVAQVSNINSSTNMLEQRLSKLNLNSPSEINNKQAVKQKPKTKNNKANVCHIKEATSSTTTCSNTSSKSETPISSGINTRENSVCSLTPTTAISKKIVKQKKKKAIATKTTKVANPKSVKQTITQDACVKTSESVMAKSTAIVTAVVQPSSSPIAVEKTKEKRPKRSKSFDTGQFDNNPFKSLHMQDSSDSEYESSSETVIVKQSNINIEPVKTVATTVVTKSTKPQTAVVVEKHDLIKANPLAKKQEIKQTPKNQSNIAHKKLKRESSNVKQQQGKQMLPPLQNPIMKKAQNNQQKLTAHAQNQENNSQQHVGVNLQDANSNARTVVSKQQQQIHSRLTYQQRTRNTGRSAGNAANFNSTNNTEPIAVTLKRGQRSKRYQKQKQDCMFGIPNNMGYFNPNDVMIPPPAAATVTTQQQQPHQQHISSVTYGNSNNLCQQLQNLQIGNNNISQQNYSKVSNVSIMDQLNRGVQVEDLSLPPGITLTKVDPIKSEQLRQKSESIRKLSKPLVSQPAQPMVVNARAAFPQVQNHPATIIPATANFYGATYAGTGLDPNGIIMVEANSKPSVQQQQQKQVSNVAAAAAAAVGSGKSSSRRRRRNKTKSGCNNSNNYNANSVGGRDDHIADGQSNGGSSTSSKMITLRNPMFHATANASPTAGASVIQQKHHQHNSLLPGRSMTGMPITATLPMDQPAAIIKNDNGMFTIRNPVLHQAVTNGLALSGYRQFGNVNYYTPQEAVAEVARTTQMQQQEHLKADVSDSNANASFSYFSTGMTNAVPDTDGHGAHNNISISCTSVNATNTSASASPLESTAMRKRLTGDAAVIARPKSTQKCISAIGSEIKQKSKETHQWSNFGHHAQQQQQDFNSDFPSATTLQEKYQQSNYYNGFDVFPTTSNSGGISASAVVGSSAGGSSGNSLFENADCHMHHSCGDDSPPPTITGFNSYLDGIPNTGVIRYDDASFLKSLIPGQQLNNEISIHNINETNFTRNNTTSPHHLEMTSAGYGNRAKTSNTYEQQINPNTGANYCDNVADYTNDSPLFVQGNLLTGLPELDVRECYHNYEFEPPNVSTSSAATSVAGDTQTQGILDFNELLRRSPHSQRTSPFNIDENVMLESFVQNMGAMQIAAQAAAAAAASVANTTSTGVTSDAKPCAHLNGISVNAANGSTSEKTDGVTTVAATSASNGWW